MKNYRYYLYLFLFVGFVIRAILSFSIEFNINHGISSDDSFYYYRIAQNISNGFGSTFDKINLTNGYQPLVLYYLVIFYYFWGSNIFTPIFLSQIILSFIATLSAYLTYVLVKKITKDEFPALLSALILFLNPIIIVINFKSLETNFYWLFIVLSLLFYNSKIKDKSQNFNDFIFGFIISLAALARLDGGFYILSFTIYLLLKKNISIIARIKRIFFTGIGFSLLFVPYLIYNKLVFNHFVPISGRAKVFHNHKQVLNQVGSYFSIDFILYEIRRFIFPFNFDLFANRGFGTFEQIAVYVLLIFILLVLLYFLKQKLLIRTIKSLVEFKFFGLFLLFHYSFYTLYFWEYRFYYFLPEIIALVILFSLLISEWLKFVQVKIRKSVVINIIFISVILIFILSGIKIFTANHEQILALKTAKWIEENIPEDKILGSANTGILSYFSQRRFVNLDGMVNNDELLEAYRKDEEAYLEYLKRYRIEYIVDYFLSPKPEYKYQFPKLLENNYEVVNYFTDKRLKYQKLNHMLVIRLKL